MVTDTVSKATERCIQENLLPFLAHVNGFGSFSDRTVFARVLPDGRWDMLYTRIFEAFSDTLPNVLRRDTRPFTPHITVANRDIPTGSATDALKHFDELELAAEFQVTAVTVFERHAGRWIPIDTTVT